MSACGRRGGPLLPSPAVMARTRDIRTNQLDIACDVCGRTLLRGEHAEPFLAGGERRQVCELCTARAQHEGWIRESGADELDAAPPAPRGPRARFVDRLRARRERAREVADARPRPEAAERRARRFDEPRAARAERRAAARAAAPRRATCARCRPTPSSRCERALEVFNASEHTRTVGGVARSLGAPGGLRAPARRPPERGRDHGDVGAVLVPLRGRPVRRGRRRAPRRARAPSCPSSTPRSRSSTPRPTSAAACTSPSRRHDRRLDGWSSAHAARYG